MTAPHRLLRTAVLSVVVLLLAAAAHASAGGGLPTLGDVALLAGPVSLAAWFATRRRLTAPALVAFVVSGQWLLHTALGALAHDVAAIGSHPHGVAVTEVATAPAHTLTATMLVAHTVAALLVALWLSAGERLLWVVVEWLRLRPLPALRAVAPLAVTSEVGRRCTARIDPLVEQVLGANVSWRGPPAAAVAV